MFRVSISLVPLDESSSTVSENEFTLITALWPSMDSSMQLMVHEEGSFALAMRVPLMVKVVIELSDLLHTTITPSEETQRACALTPTSLLISRPFLIECNSTSDDNSEDDTTIPCSELTQQQIISLKWPWST